MDYSRFRIPIIFSTHLLQVTWSKDQTLRLWDIDNDIRSRCKDTFSQDTCLTGIENITMRNEIAEEGSANLQDCEPKSGKSN